MTRTGRRTGPARCVPALALLLGAGAGFAAAPTVATPGVTSLRIAGVAPEPGRAVDGVALDPRGLALPGVEIRVVPLGVVGAPVLRALTDEGGRFTLGALAPGSYRLVAVKGGYGVLVGQINTLFEQTLELVLRPAGGPAAPGTRPEGIGWALRLPHRDPLEDRGPALDDRFDATAAAAFGPRLSLALTGSRVDGQGESTTGKGVEVDVEIYSDDTEHLGAHFDRYVEGRAGNAGRRETIESFRIGRTTSSGKLPLSLSLDIARRRNEAGDGVAREELSYDRVGFVVGSRFAGSRDAADVNATVDFLQYDGRFEGAEAPAGTVRFEGAASWRRVWGDTHDFGLDIAYSGLHRPGSGESPGERIGVVAQPDGLLEGSLAAAYDHVASLVASDRWTAGPTLELLARGRADWTLDARTAGRTMRGTTSAGARWSPLAGLSLQAEAGLTVAGSSSGRPVGVIGVEGQLASFGWSIGRSSETGPTTWDDFESFDAAGAGQNFLVGEGADVDRWTVGVEYSGSSRMPRVSMQWSRVDVDGTLAPRLPLDLALVHAGTGEGRADQAEVGVMLARTGSTVTFSWARVASIRGDLLPGDAGTWERRGVAIRQRVLGLSSGVLCEFVLAAEDAQLDRAGEATPETTLRTASLERRRLTGGVALSF